jgi:hypothetical protein
MKDVEGVTDKYSLVHRGLSLLIIGGLIVYAFQSGQLSVGSSIIFSIGRAFIHFAAVVSFIWFPNALANHINRRANIVNGRFNIVNGKLNVVRARDLRWLGWCSLPIIIYIHSY